MATVLVAVDIDRFNFNEVVQAAETAGLTVA
jgi:hypothetical protein